MRRTFQLIVTVVFIFACCDLLAQEARTSNLAFPFDGKADRTHYSDGTTTEGGAIAYGQSTFNDVFVSLPLPGGTPLTTIGAQVYPTFAGGGTFGVDGQFYVSTVGDTTEPPQIWTQDITTGAATLVGPTGLPYTEGFNGIAYDYTTGTYYGASSENLYTFDNTTGAATLVGPFNNVGGLAIDIDVDCNGIMYMHDLGLDQIFTVDKTTGNASLVGATGFNANFGQGMSFGRGDGTLYLMAFDGDINAMQLRTVDLGTGATTVVFDYGLDQIAPFGIPGVCGAPCPVGQSSNPDPPDGSTGYQPGNINLSWTNGSGATQIEVFFGGSSIYQGTPISNFSVNAPDYSTTYTWQVNSSNDTCGVAGPIWRFTTKADPTLICIFMDDFEDTVFTEANWNIVDEGGSDCLWRWFFPTYPNSYSMPLTSSGGVLSADSDECGFGTTLLHTSAVIGPFDATQYQTVLVDFDSDVHIFDVDDESWVEVSTDGGANWTEAWSVLGAELRATQESINISAQAALQSQFWVRFRSYQPGWDWWWTIDNVAIYVTDIIPVELTSFAATVNESEVNLNWATATELNNHGFEIERRTEEQFITIGFVQGKGTTTEVQNYSFTDSYVNAGTYSYRLKQVDFSGHYEYSDVIEVEVLAPAVYTLEQNYPNPFNPNTKIKFSLAADSRVTLKVFDVLGQEVVTLINGNLSAGLHNIDFNAASAAGGLNSGVYFYRIDATGVDGTNFTSVRKMILTK